MAGTSKPGNRPRSADRESGCGSDLDLSPTIKSLERMSLEDDGKRDWHKESMGYLDEHYEEWKDLKTTVMVPPCLQIDPESRNTGDQAEKKIFDLLKDFGETYHEPMFVVHSYNFSELIHKLENGYEKETEWVKGEHDFVIIHREYGVIFLEVKSKDNTKGVYKEAQSQIKKAKLATLSHIKKKFTKSKQVIKACYEWPGFVVLPNCKKQDQSGNLHDDVVYEEDCASKETFKSWWDDKIAGPSKGIDKKVYEELVIRFVPLSCLSPTLNLQIDKTHERIVTIFTPKELKAWYNSCPVQWFTGPAGSGKTVLLIEKVKEIASKIREGKKNERILVLCFNVPLNIYLQNEINDWFYDKYKTDSPVKIRTYDAFIKEVGGFDVINDGDPAAFERRRKLVEANHTSLAEDQKFEHIFVDEGQDLSGEEWPKFLERLHKKSKKSRCYFWVMFDSNQLVQLTEITNLPTLGDYLTNASQLKYVFRNTKNIFSLSKMYYEDISPEGGEIKLAHTEIGLEILWDENLKQDRSNRSELVANHTRKLQGKKVRERDIVVLTTTSEAAASLIEELKHKFISGVKAEEHLSGAEGVTVESIRRFKGLESKVVILCDPEYYPSNRALEKTRQLLYTAVSRCFCYLIIVSTPDGCQRIKSVSTHIPYSGVSSGQKRRKSTTSLQENYARLENEHQQREKYSAFRLYGKRSRENKYESGPPERKEFVDKADKDSSDEDGGIPSAVKHDPMEEKRMQRDYEKKIKPKPSRPVHVDGSGLLEPGDEYIKDQRRLNAFTLLPSVVKKNLAFTAKNFTEEEIKECIARIEYNIYQRYRVKQNLSPYTSAMRKLKKDIAEDNEENKLNSEVNKALTQM